MMSKNTGKQPAFLNALRKSTEKERFDALYAGIQHNNKIIFAGTLLRRAALLFPENTALICKDESINYRDLFIVPML